MCASSYLYLVILRINAELSPVVEVARFTKGYNMANKPDIVSYIHCRECMFDWSQTTRSVSPAEFQDNEVGFTQRGIQVWCRRHDKNVISLDINEVDVSKPKGKVIAQAMEGHCDEC